VASWKRKKPKNPPLEPPFELVEKEIHGELVMVKVYKPAWAQGDKREDERLGFSDPPNRFSRDRGPKPPRG
jgi:hypothetical protein